VCLHRLSGCPSNSRAGLSWGDIGATAFAVKRGQIRTARRALEERVAALSQQQSKSGVQDGRYYVSDQDVELFHGQG
jgi:hypothetical protein